MAGITTTKKKHFHCSPSIKEKKENYHLNKIVVAASDYVEASHWSGLPWYRNFSCSLVDNNQT